MASRTRSTCRARQDRNKARLNEGDLLLARLKQCAAEASYCTPLFLPVGLRHAGREKAASKQQQLKAVKGKCGLRHYITLNAVAAGAQVGMHLSNPTRHAFPCPLAESHTCRSTKLSFGARAEQARNQKPRQLTVSSSARKKNVTTFRGPDATR